MWPIDPKRSGCRTQERIWLRGGRRGLFCFLFIIFPLCSKSPTIASSSSIVIQSVWKYFAPSMMSKWANTAPLVPVILMSPVGFTALSMAKVERFSEVCKMTSKSWRAKSGHFGVFDLTTICLTSAFCIAVSIFSLDRNLLLQTGIRWPLLRINIHDNVCVYQQIMLQIGITLLVDRCVAGYKTRCI